MKSTAGARRAVSTPAFGHRRIISVLALPCLAIGLIVGWSNPAREKSTNTVSRVELTCRAWSQLESNHWGEAEALFRSALQTDSNHTVTLRGLGKSLDGLKKYDQAIAVYQQILGANADDGNACYGLAHSYFQQGNFESAAAAFRQYISLNPRLASGCYALYWSLAKQQNCQEALAAIRQATTLNPTNADSQTQLGFCLGQLRHYEEAFTQLNLALSLNPTNASTRRCLDFHHQQQWAGPWAVPLHPQPGKDANGVSGDDPASRAWSQLDSNHLAEATTLFRSALRSDSNNPILLDGLATS